MHRIFLSDLHLVAPETQTFQRFVECIAHESQGVDEIYILGDLVEMWIGDDDDSPCAKALIKTLAGITPHCPVYLLHGNRDFLFGETFSTLTGVQLISDPFCTDDGVLLSHGDLLCTDDKAYQEMRGTLRSLAWQQDMLTKPLAERKAFGQMLREQSKENNANKASNIMDVNRGDTDALVDSYRARAFIHGHTHRPGKHRHSSFTRIVTGAWQRCGWLCRQQGDRLQLECFSLARRYGT